MLYTSEEIAKVRSSVIKRFIVDALLFLLPFAAGMVIMFTIRIEWLSIALSIFGACLAVFFYGFFVYPFLSYYRFLRDVTGGRNREQTVCFLRKEESSLRDGVLCQSLYFMDEKQVELLCYLDMEKPYDFKEGGRYALTIHGQSIIGIQAI